MSPEGLPYNQTYGTQENLADYTPSELDQRIDTPTDPFPDEDQYMLYLRERVREAVAEQAQPAQLDPRRDVAGPSTAGTFEDADAVARALVTSTDFAAAVARHLVETTQQASRPDALPEEQFRGIYELGAVGAGGIGLSGITGVRPTGAAATMFTGREGAIGLATRIDPTWSPARREAHLVPAGVFGHIDDLTRQGRTDAQIIEEVNSLIAGEGARASFANNRPISEVFGGVSRGRDGQWRLELSDASSRITPEIVDQFEMLGIGGEVSRIRTGRFRSEPLTLGRVLEGSPIFEIYPALADVRVRIKRVHSGLDMGGDLSPGTRGNPPTINIFAPNAEAIRSVIKHEGQHWIQNAEQWAGGGYPHAIFQMPEGGTRPIWREHSIIGRLASGRVDEARQAIQQLPEWVRDSAEDIINEAARRAFNDLTPGVPPKYTGNSFEDIARFLQENPQFNTNMSLQIFGELADLNAYQRITGEVEARLSQARMDLTGSELRETPFSTMGGYIPPERQLIFPETDPVVRARSPQAMVMPAPPPPGSVAHRPGRGGRPRDIPEGFGQGVRPEDIRIAQERGFEIPQQPVTPESAEILLNSLGLEVHSIRNDKGTTYIRFYPGRPGERTLPLQDLPTIRIPPVRHMHAGSIKETEQGVLFDTTWHHPTRHPGTMLRREDNAVRRYVASHRTDEQGRPYAELDVLREELVRRYRPELAQPDPPVTLGEDPNQFRLFSGGLPVVPVVQTNVPNTTLISSPDGEYRSVPNDQVDEYLRGGWSVVEPESDPGLTQEQIEAILGYRYRR